MNVRFAANRYPAERKMRGEFSGGTFKSNRTTLFQFATNTGNPEIGELRATHIDRWFAAHQHDAPATRRNRFSEIHVFLTFAVRQGWLKRHPMLDYRAPKMPRYKPRQSPLTRRARCCLQRLTNVSG